MTTLFYSLPVLVVIALLASRRVTLFQAGLVGLLLTAVACYFALSDSTDYASFLVTETGRGVWLAWQALSVVLAGLMFHHIVKTAHPELFEPSAHTLSVFSYRQLFTVCFFLGPFFEAVTGFGVGMVITIPFLLRMGITGPRAVALALFSQILVPWGALAIGTMIGAGLSGVTPQELGEGSALLSIPLLFGYLFIFWRLAKADSGSISLRQRFEDLGWVAALGILLYAANRFVAVETAGFFATGILLIIRFMQDVRAGKTVWSSTMRPAIPYVALTVVLLATRVLAPLRELLQENLVIHPIDGGSSFPVLYHVSFWLVLVGVAYGITHNRDIARWKKIISSMWEAARNPLAVTLVFVLMAQLMTSAGIAQALASAWGDVAGQHAVLATPLFAAVAGFLTGSNVGSNAMMMPLQSALAGEISGDVYWLSAVQNTAGSNFTMLSAVRVAMGCALLRISGSEHEIYRLALPFGMVTIGTLFIVSFII